MCVQYTLFIWKQRRTDQISVWQIFGRRPRGVSYVFAKYAFRRGIVADDNACTWARGFYTACTAHTTACCKRKAAVAPTPSSAAADSSGPRRTLLSSWWCKAAALTSFVDEVRQIFLALWRPLYHNIAVTARTRTSAILKLMIFVSDGNG